MAPTSNICDARPRRKESESEDEEMKLIFQNKNISPYNKFGPLVVVFVGLPASGKTVLAHKLENHLNWLNYNAKVFNVSSYRRKHIELYDSHNLFRVDNQEAYEIRRLSIHEAQEDATEWLTEDGQVAILDGPHASNLVRQDTYDHFVNQLGYKVLFVECIVTDQKMLQSNVKEILQFSKDYKQMSMEKALDDLYHRIEHYKEQYDPIDNNLNTFSVIKVFNAGESVSACGLEGSLQREVLHFVSYFKPTSRTYYFSRHGESENNVLDKIGGDASLSSRGKSYATALGQYFNEAKIMDLHIWTSEKERTQQTAQEIKAPIEIIAALNELHAGVCEELTYDEMKDQYPQEFAWRDKDKLRYRYPWGESYVDIMNRLRPVLMELESENNILLIGHQAVLRCVLGYFLRKPFDELPYINMPLHTIIKLTTSGYKYKMEIIKLNVDSVDTYRKRPQNCSDKNELTNGSPKRFDAIGSWVRTPTVN